MNGQPFSQQPEDLNKNITLGVLLEYTDEVLLPKMEETIRNVATEVVTGVVRVEIGKSENRMMDYIDRKLADHTLELFKRLEHRFQSEHQFKDKIVELFRRHNIGTSEDLAFLDGLVKGGW